MKKELFAIITIVSLSIGSVVNILYLKNLTDAMTQQVESAISECGFGNYSVAEEKLESALKKWTSAKRYTHIFIRHAEIDATTDAYYDALSALKEEHPSALSSLDKVKYHIESLLSMEMPTIKSVF